MKELKKSYLLRVNAGVLSAVQQWADADLRSLNAQIEFLLRRALGESGATIPVLRELSVAAVEEEEEIFRPEDL